MSEHASQQKRHPRVDASLTKGQFAIGETQGFQSLRLVGLQRMANNSPVANGLRILQQKADAGPASTHIGAMAPPQRSNLHAPLQRKGVIQRKPPDDPHVFVFTDQSGLVWSRDLETDEWKRPGDNGENIWYEDEMKARAKEQALQDILDEAGTATGYFQNPASIWGIKHDALWAELEPFGFTVGKYGGTSDAHEYLKECSDGSKISIVVNYGGGRHSHAEGKKTYEPAFYYKLVWGGKFTKTKVVNSANYPEMDAAKEKYAFVWI